MSRKISIVPPVDCFCSDYLFDQKRSDSGAHSLNIHWMDYCHALKHQAVLSGHEIHTYDILKPADADIVVFMRTPPSLSALQKLKEYNRNIHLVYMPVETMVGSGYLFDTQNLIHYGTIFTHDPGRTDGVQIFSLPTRTSYPFRQSPGAPYDSRHFASFIASYRPFRIKSGLGIIRKQEWRFSLSSYIDYALSPGDLSVQRKKLGLSILSSKDPEIHLFGQGWTSISSCGSNFFGIPNVSSLSLLQNYKYTFAYENHSASGSLISERIWDALWSGCVPIYMGNTNITDVIPSECFISASSFYSPSDIIDYIKSLSPAQWLDTYNCIREFLSSSAIEKYLPNNVASYILSVITR